MCRLVVVVAVLTVGISVSIEETASIKPRDDNYFKDESPLKRWYYYEDGVEVDNRAHKEELCKSLGGMSLVSLGVNKHQDDEKLVKEELAHIQKEVQRISGNKRFKLYIANKVKRSPRKRRGILEKRWKCGKKCKEQLHKKVKEEQILCPNDSKLCRRCRNWHSNCAEKEKQCKKYQKKRGKCSQFVSTKSRDTGLGPSLLPATSGTTRPKPAIPKPVPIRPKPASESDYKGRKGVHVPAKFWDDEPDEGEDCAIVREGQDHAMVESKDCDFAHMGVLCKSPRVPEARLKKPQPSGAGAG